jgi:hypothetical protein
MLTFLLTPDGAFLTVVAGCLVNNEEPRPGLKNYRLCHFDIKERFLVASLLEMTDLKTLLEMTFLKVTSNVPLSLRTHVRSLKYPSLCSGQGFLVATLLEMTDLKALLEMTK